MSTSDIERGNKAHNEKSYLITFPDKTMKLLTLIQCCELEECSVKVPCLNGRFRTIDNSLTPNEKSKLRYQLIIKTIKTPRKKILERGSRQSETKVPLWMVGLMPAKV